MLGGRLLANLSHQANYLGKFDEAVQLARAAQATTFARPAATVSAMFLAMEARALAGSGQARACRQVLHKAEQAFERRDPSRDPSWISYFNPEELAGEAAHCFRDLGRSEETRLFGAQALDPATTPLRTRAFIGMVNATGALTGGNLDEAVALATEAVDLAGPLQSRRYVRYLADFHGSLVAKHAGHPLVVLFTEKAAQYHPMFVPASA